MKERGLRSPWDPSVFTLGASHSSTTREAPVKRQYVGIDLHRRRSVIYRMDAAGKKLDCVGIDNDPLRLAEEVAKASPGAEVVVEATYGWYWAVICSRRWGCGCIWPIRRATIGACGG